MEINIRNRELLEEKFEIRNVKRTIRDLVERESKRLEEISIILLRDRELLKINKDFLQHNYFTDVITFSYNRRDEICGDIFISVDTVRSNARKFKQGFMDELIRVIIHGVLHLTGYDDRSVVERGVMKEKENFYLKQYKAIRNE